eukprot:361313-Chlamydomonas_euryale.AAC.6
MSRLEQFGLLKQVGSFRNITHCSNGNVSRILYSDPSAEQRAAAGDQVSVAPEVMRNARQVRITATYRKLHLLNGQESMRS